MDTCKDIRVAIVGGSIAGCAMAIELSRIGCQVTVLERSRHGLRERGTGIAMPIPLVQELMRRDLVDRDIGYLPTQHVARIAKSSGNALHGQLIWKQPSQVAQLRWDVLFQQLRARVPDDCYLHDCAVQAAFERQQRVSLQLQDGRVFEVDLAIFCDGYRSRGRGQLFPAAVPQYAGHVLWRGLLPEHELRDSGPLEDTLVTALYSGGYGAFYFVRAQAGYTGPSSRSVNWALYLQVPAVELPRWLTDSNGVVHAGSVPAGMLPSATERECKHKAASLLPDYYARLLQQTCDTFLQAVFDTRVPGYCHGRMLLSGDAGALAMPTTGSGALKALQDAADLAAALRAHPSLAAATSAWDRTRTRRGNRLVDYGRQLALALLTDSVDWSTMDAAALQARLASIVTAYDAPAAALARTPAP
jgi:2-polyprenyl-6-methoxyphenol hydroxylase-like FAD-dependent oxidoreductase